MFENVYDKILVKIKLSSYISPQFKCVSLSVVNNTPIYSHKERHCFKILFHILFPVFWSERFKKSVIQTIDIKDSTELYINNFVRRSKITRTRKCWRRTKNLYISTLRWAIFALLHLNISYKWDIYYLDTLFLNFFNLGIILTPIRILLKFTHFAGGHVPISLNGALHAWYQS